jgi:RNA polymerase sigma-70 factor (ECF subfamily)
VQDAVLAALRHWPGRDPERPDAWLFTVARHQAWMRFGAKATAPSWRKCSGRFSQAQRSAAVMFTCAAALQGAQIALTLRVVCGLTTAQIARAFLVHETTMGQRITRADGRCGAGIPYRIPADPAAPA